MDTDDDTVQEEINSEEVESHEEVFQEVEQREEERVPLSALQKERRKRQEAEKRAKLFEDMQEKQLREEKATATVTEDDQYEVATKGEVRTSKAELMREIEEKQWARENPEKIEDLNERLVTFLKNKKNLVSAINDSSNRFEEAWTLMNALSPQQQKAAAIKQTVKKDSPGSPGSVPKAAAINAAIDVMGMSDAEFNQWRRTKQRRS